MPEKSADKILAVRITGSDKAVRSFLTAHPLETESRKHEGELVTIDVHVPERLVEQIKSMDLKVQVLHDASARGRERQKEVGKGNRFEGDQKIPTGLGTRTGEGPR